MGLSRGGHRRRQPCGDLDRQGVLRLARGRSHHAFDPGGRRRLDALGPAPAEQLLPDSFRPPFGLGDVLGQPGRELVGVPDAAFPEAQGFADLGPVALGLAA